MTTHRTIRPRELDALPVQIRHEVTLNCSPEELFAVFDDEQAWTEWLGITVVWHDGPPYAAGMSRTITQGAVRALERFTVYEEGHRMAFYFEESTLFPINAFAEDWLVEPVDGGRCRLVWRIGIEPWGPFRVFGWAFRLSMRRMGQRSLPRLAARFR